MKLETAKIHKTNCTASLVPHLSAKSDGDRKRVAFYIRGKYFPVQKANNLYNRTNPSLPPSLPRRPYERIMQNDFPVGDIPCYVLDRGTDIEIIVK